MLRSAFVAAAILFATLSSAPAALACPMADAAAFSTAQAEVQAATGTKVALTVEGMHCGDCSTKVSAALKGIDGVVAVAVDYQTGRTEIAYDAKKVTLDAMLKAVTDTGFKAQKADA